jgi:LysR family glycine cleavage system transcriptional activator
MDWSDMPPLSMLRAFEAAARGGGFSAAGRELNVTHAAVAQQVRGLERRLGVALMRREGRGLSLTPEGRKLAEGLGAGFETMRGALAALAAEAADRPVRATLTPSFASNWLMPRLGRFRARHPEVELLLNPSSEVVDLRRGDYDVGVRFGKGVWPGLETEKLASTSIALVATPALLAQYRVETPRDLLSAPWVQELDQDEWRVWLAQYGVPVEGKRNTLHLPAHLAHEAIRDGQGVGMIAHLFVEDDLRAGRLVSLFPREDDDGVGYHIVRPPGAMRADVAAFVSWLRREAREDAARRPASLDPA